MIKDRTKESETLVAPCLQLLAMLHGVLASHCPKGHFWVNLIDSILKLCADRDVDLFDFRRNTPSLLTYFLGGDATNQESDYSENT